MHFFTDFNCRGRILRGLFSLASCNVAATCAKPSRDRILRSMVLNSQYLRLESHHCQAFALWGPPVGGLQARLQAHHGACIAQLPSPGEAKPAILGPPSHPSPPPHPSHRPARSSPGRPATPHQPACCQPSVRQRTMSPASAAWPPRNTSLAAAASCRALLWGSGHLPTICPQVLRAMHAASSCLVAGTLSRQMLLPLLAS